MKTIFCFSKFTIALICLDLFFIVHVNGQHELWIKKLIPIDTNFVECMESIDERFSKCLYKKEGLPHYCVIEEDSTHLTITQRQGYWQNEVSLSWAYGYFQLGSMIYIVSTTSENSQYKILNLEKIYFVMDTNSYIRHPFLVGKGLEINDYDFSKIILRKQENSYHVECQCDCMESIEDCPNLKAGNFFTKRKIVIKSPYVQEKMFGRGEFLVHFDNIKNLKVLTTNTLDLSIYDSRQNTIFQYQNCRNCSRTEESEYYCKTLEQTLSELSFNIYKKHKLKRRPIWKREYYDNLSIKQWKISNWEPILIYFVVVPIN